MSKKYEYVWLDGYTPEPTLRSKIRVGDSLTNWAFDGSSTKQATGDYSDCILKPVAEYNNPFLKGNSKLVMCEVLLANEASHPTNTRTKIDHLNEEWWFGFEQEYFMYKGGRPLGWPAKKEPRPQGDYYCGVGAGNVAGREIIEEHLDKCLEAGIGITGTNAEVALAQWEYQCLGKGTKAGDDLWMSRYILLRVAEKYEVVVNFHPKPVKGDWNGSGMHTNFSNTIMRDSGTQEIMTNYCKALEETHQNAMKVYGSDNDQRLTGYHETQSIDEFTYGVNDRGASIRIPNITAKNDWHGYLEDRRPASNADPYLIMKHIINTIYKSIYVGM